MKDIEPIPWRGFRAYDMLVAILLPTAAGLALLLPFLDQALLRRLLRLPGGDWLVSLAVNNGAWILVLGLLLLWFLYLIWRRQQIVSDKRLWAGTGCPNCGERELVRVSRRFSDRFYSLAAVPAYRYACRNCTWRGLRIARREHSPKLDEELQAALLRFDPDAGLVVAAPVGPAKQDNSAADMINPVVNTAAQFHDSGDVPSPPATPTPTVEMDATFTAAEQSSTAGDDVVHDETPAAPDRTNEVKVPPEVAPTLPPHPEPTDNATTPEPITANEPAPANAVDQPLPEPEAAAEENDNSPGDAELDWLWQRLADDQ